MKSDITNNEVSKCCGARACWNFSFKSCDKCGKRFEPCHQQPEKEDCDDKETREYLPLVNKLLEKSNTYSHAQRELDILLKTTPDAIIRHFIPEILAICEAFGKSGQSGGSAPYTASALSQAIKKLCLHQTIAPLTGEYNEWVRVGEILYTGERGDVWQNNRLSSIFKEDNKVYYLDAITWKTQKGSSWHGSAKTESGEEITSRQYIKSFPFKPQEFTIDVIEKEVSKDNWEFTIKNEKDLEKVWEVYDKFTK